MDKRECSCRLGNDRHSKYMHIEKGKGKGADIHNVDSNDGINLGGGTDEQQKNAGDIDNISAASTVPIKGSFFLKVGGSFGSHTPCPPRGVT